MALKVEIKKYGATIPGTDWYYLTASTIEHNITRLPSQVPLTGNFVFVLDLDMALETISVRGVVGTEVEKESYRTAAMTWQTGITDFKYGTDMPKLILNSSEAYYGVVKSWTFRQEAGMLELNADQGWEYDLSFAVKAKVP